MFSYHHFTESGLIGFPIPQTIPYDFSLTQATAGLFIVFTVGGAWNAGRAFLMRGASFLFSTQVSESSLACSNICYNSSARNRIRGVQEGRCPKSTQYRQRHRTRKASAMSALCSFTLAHKCLKCHPRTFRRVPCRDDVLFWLYAYLIRIGWGYMLTSF